MQFVTSREVREGMCVAQNICDDQGRVLIMRGQRLGSHHLVRLRKFGISGLFIDPDNGEGTPKLTRSEIREQCEKVLHDSCSKLRQEFAGKKVALDQAAITQCTNRMVEALMKSKNPMVTLLDLDTGSDRLMQHSVNTAVLATVLALDLRLPEEMVKQLAVGMLFHDIGTIFLPEELSRKTSPPNSEEIVLLRQHTQLGFEHLVRTDAIGQISANVVFRHHEALDGTGYPQGIKGDDLSHLMRIAAVAEAYDSMTTPRFGIAPVLPDAAITFLINQVGKRFAREVVISLCKRVAIYPKGTAVKLSTGECAIVAGVMPSAPTRPIVLVQVDRTGKPLKCPLIVDLSKELGYRIVRSAPCLEALAKDREPLTAPPPVNPVYASLG